MQNPRAPFERISQLLEKAGCLRDIGKRIRVGFSKSAESRAFSAEDSTQPSRRSLKRISRGSRTVPAPLTARLEGHKVDSRYHEDGALPVPVGSRRSHMAAAWLPVARFRDRRFAYAHSRGRIFSRRRTHEHVRDPVSRRSFEIIRRPAWNRYADVRRRRNGLDLRTRNYSRGDCNQWPISLRRSRSSLLDGVEQWFVLLEEGAEDRDYAPPRSGVSIATLMIFFGARCYRIVVIYFVILYNFIFYICNLYRGRRIF